MTQLSNSNINAVADLKPGYTLGAADVALLQEMARRLLAAETQEPVRYLNKFTGVCVTLEQQPDASTDTAVYVPLFAAPQPVAVPDDDEFEKAFRSWNPDKTGPYVKHQMKFIWNACRAAMLNAEPVSQPYTLPHWIPCSERMPEESGRYLCYVEEQNSLGKSHYQWNCSWNGDVWSDKALTGRVTHWMPLPAVPQEPTK